MEERYQQVQLTSEKGRRGESIDVTPEKTKANRRQDLILGLVLAIKNLNREGFRDP